MDDSAVTFADGLQAAFTGDAVRLYQAKVVRQRLKACQIGMRLNSSYTPTNCKLMATKFTGKSMVEASPLSHRRSPI